MNGFLLVNKPKGITSFDVVRQVRKVLDMRKVGHAGTLDPLAEGLMIVAVGEGTKLLEYLLKSKKTYEAEITFGSESETYDAEGKLTRISDEEFDLIKIQKALEKFEGKIKQVPPKYSALKINGKKAYELARKGEEIEMKPREVEVFGIEVLNYIYPKLSLEIDCSTGTYIRSIAHDLGRTLGVGGYLTKLKRTKIGEYLLEDSVDLEDISSQKILPLEWALGNLKQIDLSLEEYNFLKNGRQISCNFNIDEAEVVACLYNEKIVSICKIDSTSKKLQPVKNFNQEQASSS